MKKFLASVLLLPAFAFAQQQQQPQGPVTVEKPVVCVSAEVLMDALEKSESKEVPYWMGTDAETYWGMLVNEKTGTWTIIQFNRDIGCIIGAGENHGHMIQKTK